MLWLTQLLCPHFPTLVADIKRLGVTVRVRVRLVVFRIYVGLEVWDRLG